MRNYHKISDSSANRLSQTAKKSKGAGHIDPASEQVGLKCTDSAWATHRSRTVSTSMGDSMVIKTDEIKAEMVNDIKQNK